LQPQGCTKQLIRVEVRDRATCLRLAKALGVSVERLAEAVDDPAEDEEA
jgi:hypothetical protein